MGENAVIGAIQHGAGNILDYFINFGGELAVIEKVLLFVIAPAAGILISAWGVFDLLKMRNPRVQNKPSPISIIIRFCIGPITIQLALLMSQLSESFFGTIDIEINEGLATSYVTSANNATDPVKAGMLTAVAFLVVVGWIAGLRAMVAFARIGSPGENGYELFRTGAARIIAATFLCMFQFLLDDMIESFTGVSGAFSSGLDL